MIFPMDVFTNKENKIKEDSKLKNTFIVMLIGIINVGCLFLVQPLIFRRMEVPFIVRFIIQLLIFVLMMIPVYRYLIFDEKTRIQEKLDSDNDSIGKYWYVRSTGITNLSVKDYQVPVFELENGNSMFSFVIRFGSNNRDISKTTKYAFRDVYNELIINELETSIITLPENYSTSKESLRLRSIPAKVKDAVLKRVEKEVVNHVIRQTNQQNNTSAMWFVCRTTSSVQRFILDDVIGGLISKWENKRTAFRDVEFLDMNKFEEMARDYYNIDVIDLSLADLRNLENSETTFTNEDVRIYSITSTSGKVFQVKDKDFMKTDVIDL